MLMMVSMFTSHIMNNMSNKLVHVSSDDDLLVKVQVKILKIIVF